MNTLKDHRQKRCAFRYRRYDLLHDRTDMARVQFAAYGTGWRALLLVCGSINEFLGWDMLIWKQMFICAVGITAIEFLSGYILNIVLGLGIWDYSNMPFNIIGQICLPFTVAWYILSLLAIVLDDHLRYWIFGEEKPRYKWR